jgi:hypothetical protein
MMKAFMATFETLLAEPENQVPVRFKTFFQDAK